VSIQTHAATPIPAARAGRLIRFRDAKPRAANAAAPASPPTTDAHIEKDFGNALGTASGSARKARFVNAKSVSAQRSTRSERRALSQKRPKTR